MNAKRIIKEVEMLRFKLGRLRSWLHPLDDSAKVPPIEEARRLQYECELIESWQCAKKKNLLFNRQALTHRLLNDGSGPDGLPGYSHWIETHLAAQDNVLRENSQHLKPSFGCPSTSCARYIYGFKTLDEVKLHLENSHPSQTHPDNGLQKSERAPKLQDFSAAQSSNPQPVIAAEDLDIIQVSFETGLAKKRTISGPEPLKKHRKISQEDKENIRVVKEISPCLRCKILKKQCDGENPCRTCPKKDVNAQTDHWRFLGCHRGSLRDLAELLVPETKQAHNGKKQICDACRRRRSTCIVEDGHASCISCQYDEQTCSLDPASFWIRWLEHESETNRGSDRHFSCFLEAMYVNGYECVNCLGTTSMTWASFAEHTVLRAKHFNADCPESLAVAGCAGGLFLLEALNLESSFYQTLHMTNESCPYVVFQEKGNLLALAVAVLRYRKATPSSKILGGHDGSVIDKDHGFVVEEIAKLKSLVAASIAGDIAFSCSRRRDFSPQEYTSCFTLLCVLGTVKSILIDAESMIDNGTLSNASQRASIMGMESAYKALVGVFSWASKSDLLREDHLKYEAGSPPGSGVPNLGAMAQCHKWKRRGITSTKDFLLGLGSGFYNDGTYKGFYVQRYGLEEHLKVHQKTSPQIDEASLQPSPVGKLKGNASNMNLGPGSSPNNDKPHHRPPTISYGGRPATSLPYPMYSPYLTPSNLDTLPLQQPHSQNLPFSPPF